MLPKYAFELELDMTFNYKKTNAITWKNMFVLLIICTKGEPIHNVFEAFSRLAVTPTYSNITFNKLEIIEHLTVLTFNKKNSIWNTEHLVVMSTRVTLTHDNKHVIQHQYISSYSTLVHVYHFPRKCNEDSTVFS